HGALDHRERQPHVAREHAGALKSFGRDADDRERLAVDVHAAADDAWIAVEAAHPIPVAQHGDRGRAQAIAVDGAEQTPSGGTHAEAVEVVDRYELAEDALGTGGIAVDLEALGVRKHLSRVHTRYGGPTRADVEVCGIRQVAETAIVAGGADVDETIG